MARYSLQPVSGTPDFGDDYSQPSDSGYSLQRVQGTPDFADSPEVRQTQGATPPTGSHAPNNQPQPNYDAAHAEARAYLDAHPEARPGWASSLANKVGQGFTLGWADEAAAGLRAGYDYLRHPGQHSLGHYYDREKAMQDELLKDAADKTGWLGTGAEIVGGLGSGVGLGAVGSAMRGVQGANTAAKVARGAGQILAPALEGQGPIGRIGYGAVQGAGLGALAGAGTAESGFDNRLTGAGVGGVTGGAIGGAVPAIVEGAKFIGSPLISGYKAYTNPKGYAQDKFVETLGRSGQSIDDINTAIADANAAGQSKFTYADALGESGQKQLGGMMKLPGQSKQQAAEWLAARNHGMGRDVQGFVDDAFNTHGYTADEFTQLMDQQRGLTGDVKYGRARVGAGPVDTSPTVEAADRMLYPSGVSHPNVSGGGPRTNAEDAILGARDLIQTRTGSAQASNFDQVLSAKQALDDQIEVAIRAGRKNEASRLINLKNSLNTQLEQAAPGYKAANDTFSRMSAPQRGVEAGQRAVSRGRAIDNINNFNQMGRPEQQGFRVGYADKLNESLGGPTVGGKISEMLHGDVADEIGAFAHPARVQQLNDQLQRAGTMIRTGNIANGGSPTAELLGQQADMGISPTSFARNLAQMNVPGIIGDLINGGKQYYGGNTEAVRDQLIPMLLSGKVGNNPVPVNIDNLVRTFQQNTANRASAGDAFRRAVNSTAAPTIMQQINEEHQRAKAAPTVSRAGTGYVQTRPAPAAPVVVNRNGRR